MQDEEPVRLARSLAKTIRKARMAPCRRKSNVGGAFSTGRLDWPNPRDPCCLGLLLTPLLVTCDGPGRLAAFSNLAVLVS